MQRFQLGTRHHRIRLPVLTGHRGERFLSGGRLRSRLEPNVVSVHRDIGPAYLVSHQYNCRLSDQNVLFTSAVSTCQFNFLKKKSLKCMITSPHWTEISVLLTKQKAAIPQQMKVKWRGFCVGGCLFVDVMKLCFFLSDLKDMFQVSWDTPLSSSRHH